MSGVPYTFGNATTSIPLSQLDVNFATNATLGNASVSLGNTTTTVVETFVNPTSVVVVFPRPTDVVPIVAFVAKLTSNCDKGIDVVALPKV